MIKLHFAVDIEEIGAPARRGSHSSAKKVCNVL